GLVSRLSATDACFRSLTHPFGAVPFEVDAAARVEHHALGLEQRALAYARVAGDADLAAAVEHAVPGHRATGRQRGHRIADLARAATDAACDHAVARDGARRQFHHARVD